MLFAKGHFNLSPFVRHDAAARPYICITHFDPDFYGPAIHSAQRRVIISSTLHLYTLFEGVGRAHGIKYPRCQKRRAAIFHRLGVRRISKALGKCGMIGKTRRFSYVLTYRSTPPPLFPGDDAANLSVKQRRVVKENKRALCHALRKCVRGVCRSSGGSKGDAGKWGNR